MMPLGVVGMAHVIVSSRDPTPTTIGGRTSPGTALGKEDQCMISMKQEVESGPSQGGVPFNFPLNTPTYN